MRKLLLITGLLILPALIYGQKTYPEFILSKKFVEGPDESLAKIVDESVVYHNETPLGKSRWAINTKKQTQLYVLKDPNIYGLVLIKNQSKINSIDFRNFISSKDKELLDIWTRTKEEIYSENIVTDDRIDHKILKTGFGNFENKYNYVFTKSLISRKIDGMFQYDKTYFIVINELLYSIHIKSQDEYNLDINNVLIDILLK
jgi:hypothetical protein